MAHFAFQNEYCVNPPTVAPQLRFPGSQVPGADSNLNVLCSVRVAPARLRVNGREVVDRIDWTRLINRLVTALTGVSHSARVHSLPAAWLRVCMQRFALTWSVDKLTFVFASKWSSAKKHAPSMR